MSYLYNRSSSGVFGDPWLQALARESVSSGLQTPPRPAFDIPPARGGQFDLDNQGAARSETTSALSTRLASADGPTGDATTDAATALARMIFGEAAERHRAPRLYDGIGWTALNRLGAPGFASTLEGVLAPGQFNAVGGPLWRRAGNPTSLIGDNADAYAHALRVARDILEGGAPDPTGGATFFYSGDTPPGFFANSVRSGHLVPSAVIDPFTFLRDPQARRR